MLFNYEDPFIHACKRVQVIPGKMKISFVICVAIFLPCFASSNKGKRLTRLENRLEIMETRQDQDRIARREDIAELGLRLDDVETLVNSSVNGVTPCQSNDDQTQQEGDLQDSVASDLLIVQTAFAEEKARWRQEATTIENMITDIKHEVMSVAESSEREVKYEVERLEKSITDTHNSDIKRLQDSDKAVQNDIERIEKSIKRIQKSDREIKSDVARLEMSINTMKDDILDELKGTLEDKLGSMEKMIEGLIWKPQTKAMIYSSCLELYRSGEQESGVYEISPAPGKPALLVYCDMDTDGGGWTVFQRRKDGSVDFNRNWDAYAAGFGFPYGEFWLGNTHISAMTSECCHELRIELEDSEGNTVFAKYSKFKVLPETDNFRLQVIGYSGNASDSLQYHNDLEFSTHDRDNDNTSWENFARTCKGGWWFDYIFHSNLNGEYKQPGTAIYRYVGVKWHEWKTSSLKMTEMKFRRLDN